MPGARLWLYTNFHCNLACDYCCVASSPQAPRRELGAERIARLVSEAAAWGVRELYLTGGEPFLLADIDTIVRSLRGRAAHHRAHQRDGVPRPGPPRAGIDAAQGIGAADQPRLRHRGPARHASGRGQLAEGRRRHPARAVPRIPRPGGRDRRRAGAATAAAPSTGSSTTSASHADDQVCGRSPTRALASKGVVLTRETLVPEIDRHRRRRLLASGGRDR